jgi:hypothetical protein
MAQYKEEIDSILSDLEKEKLRTNFDQSDNLQKVSVDLNSQIEMLKNNFAKFLTANKKRDNYLEQQIKNLRTEMILMRTEFKDEMILMRTEFKDEMILMRTEFQNYMNSVLITLFSLQMN